MKKFISVLMSSILACSACISINANAALDNNGNYHANSRTYGQPYSNPHSYFSRNYGWGNSSESKPMYKNGVHSANLFSCYNPEVIGTEKAEAWVGRANNKIGFYLDSCLSYNGQKKWAESKTNYINGSTKNTRCFVWNKNGTSITYYGIIYW